jgi:hypothetical protein
MSSALRGSSWGPPDKAALRFSTPSHGLPIPTFASRAPAAAAGKEPDYRDISGTPEVTRPASGALQETLSAWEVRTEMYPPRRAPAPALSAPTTPTGAGRARLAERKAAHRAQPPLAQPPLAQPEPPARRTCFDGRRRGGAFPHGRGGVWSRRSRAGASQHPRPPHVHVARGRLRAPHWLIARGAGRAGRRARAAAVGADARGERQDPRHGEAGAQLCLEIRVKQDKTLPIFSHLFRSCFGGACPVVRRFDSRGVCGLNPRLRQAREHEREMEAMRRALHEARPATPSARLTVTPTAPNTAAS